MLKIKGISINLKKKKREKVILNHLEIVFLFFFLIYQSLKECIL